MLNSILTDAGARWTLAFDVIALRIGLVAGLLEIVANLKTRARLNFRHERFFYSGIVRVSTASVRCHSGTAVETETRNKNVLTRCRLNSPLGRSARCPRPRASSQLSCVPPVRNRSVSTRPPSQLLGSSGRLRSAESYDSTRQNRVPKSSPPSQGGVSASSSTGWVWTSVLPARPELVETMQTRPRIRDVPKLRSAVPTVVSTPQTSRALSRCLFILSETNVSIIRFRVQSSACTSPSPQQAKACTLNFSGTPGHGTKLRRVSPGRNATVKERASTQAVFWLIFGSSRRRTSTLPHGRASARTAKNFSGTLGPGTKLRRIGTHCSTCRYL